MGFEKLEKTGIKMRKINLANRSNHKEDDWLLSTLNKWECISKFNGVSRSRFLKINSQNKRRQLKRTEFI